MKFFCIDPCVVKKVAKEGKKWNKMKENICIDPCVIK